LAALETKSGTPKVLTRSLSHDKMLRLRGIETKNGANVVLSRHVTQLDGAGRRTKATRENGQRWDYQYDEIGQVEDAKKKFPGSGGTIPGHDFQYTYDGIGNRLSAVEGGTGPPPLAPASPTFPMRSINTRPSPRKAGASSSVRLRSPTR
jgi:hypothetical protein